MGSKITWALVIIRVKNSYLMQFYEINICQVVIFRFYTAYKNLIWYKLAKKLDKNRKYYRKYKYSNNFAAECNPRYIMYHNFLCDPVQEKLKLCKPFFIASALLYMWMFLMLILFYLIEYKHVKMSLLKNYAHWTQNTGIL